MRAAPQASLIPAPPRESAEGDQSYEGDDDPEPDAPEKRHDDPDDHQDAAGADPCDPSRATTIHSHVSPFAIRSDTLSYQYLGPGESYGGEARATTPAPTAENRRVTIVHVTHDVDEAVYLADRVLVLTPSPGTIAASIEVEFPRPRTQTATRSSARFFEVRNELHDVIERARR